MTAICLFFAGLQSTIGQNLLSVLFVGVVSLLLNPAHSAPTLQSLDDQQTSAGELLIALGLPVLLLLQICDHLEGILKNVPTFK